MQLSADQVQKPYSDGTEPMITLMRKLVFKILRIPKVTLEDLKNILLKSNIEELDISLASSHGETFLHATAHYGMDDLVPKLILRGIDRNRKDAYGRTALHRAMQNNHPETARILLKFGLNPKLADKEGLTALTLTSISSYTLPETQDQVKLDNTMIIPELIASITEQNREDLFNKSIIQSHLAAISMLISQGVVNANHQFTITGAIPLELAVLRRNQRHHNKEDLLMPSVLVAAGASFDYSELMSKKYPVPITDATRLLLFIMQHLPHCFTDSANLQLIIDLVEERHLQNFHHDYLLAKNRIKLCEFINQVLLEASSSLFYRFRNELQKFSAFLNAQEIVKSIVERDEQSHEQAKERSESSDTTKKNKLDHTVLERNILIILSGFLVYQLTTRVENKFWKPYIDLLLFRDNTGKDEILPGALPPDIELIIASFVIPGMTELPFSPRRSSCYGSILNSQLQMKLLTQRVTYLVDHLSQFAAEPIIVKHSKTIDIIEKKSCREVNEIDLEKKVKADKNSAIENLLIANRSPLLNLYTLRSQKTPKTAILPDSEKMQSKKIDAIPVNLTPASPTRDRTESPDGNNQNSDHEILVSALTKNKDALLNQAPLLRDSISQSDSDIVKSTQFRNKQTTEISSGIQSPSKSRVVRRCFRIPLPSDYCVML